MFEVGMSALVLKICSEYAKSLGFNFPPCTQQEINAICQWVDKHAVKDMTISQDGYIVTFTFKAEYDTTKEFTITIPKAVDIDELEKVLVGSDTVVVERLADNSGLRVSVSQSVLNSINGKLTKPTNPASDSVVTMTANGTVGTKPLSEIGGGGKLYLHGVFVSDRRDQTGISLFFYTSSNVAFTASTFKTYFREHYNYSGVTGKGNHMNKYYPSYAYVDTYSGSEHDNDVITYYKIVDGVGSETTLVLSEFESYGSFYDTVTEV